MHTTCTILQERTYNGAIFEMILIPQMQIERALFSEMPFTTREYIPTLSCHIMQRIFHSVIPGKEKSDNNDVSSQ